MKYMGLILISVAGIAVLNHQFQPVSATGTLDSNLLQKLQFSSSQTANVVVTLSGGVSQALNNLLPSSSFSTRGERITAIVKTLKQNAAVSQSPLLSFLKAQKLLNPLLNFKSYWISNQITIQNADFNLVNSLISFTNNLGIETIREQVYHLIQPIQNVTAPVLGPVLGWGVEAIGAKKAWDEGIDGTGIILASIDTGVRTTHHALVDSYLGGPYAWYDPSNTSPLVPTDVYGHGSHTTGIMCGSGPSQIGVAKGAKFIACRGCNGDACSVDDLLSCGQYAICPFKNGNHSDTDCSKAPHIINNSWGGGSPGDTTFRNMIQSWASAGIIPVFAIGNSGPLCETAGSPGDDDKSMLISVGGTDKTGGLGYFSSKGPSVYNTIKPEISAPGDLIYSSYNSTDDTYVPLSGTSMATPHVSGVIALMLQKNPNLTLPDIQDILFKTTTEGNPVGFASISCTNDLANSPNNEFGFGIVNALNALQ